MAPTCAKRDSPHIKIAVSIALTPVKRSSRYSSDASCQMKYRYASLNDWDTF